MKTPEVNIKLTPMELSLMILALKGLRRACIGANPEPIAAELDRICPQGINPSLTILGMIEKLTS